MKSYKIKLIDAFTEKPFGGNPAGVVTKADGLSDTEMQNIAKEMNISETAFILPSKKADFFLRWFTPVREIPFCGHATIASLHALAEEKTFRINSPNTYKFKVETLSGVLPITLKKEEKSTEIFLSSPEIDFIKKESINRATLSKALNISEGIIQEDHPILKEKHSGYIFIPIKKFSQLKSIKYDYQKLESFGIQNNLKGFHLFCMETVEENSQVHSRFFSPFYGMYEDPVTGSAQGPLAIYLKQHNLINTNLIRSEQGDIMGRPGRLQIKISEKDNTSKIILIGKATTFLNGEIQI